MILYLTIIFNIEERSSRESRETPYFLFSCAEF